jgi:hypothetical protein
MGLRPSASEHRSASCIPPMLIGPRSTAEPAPGRCTGCQAGPGGTCRAATAWPPLLSRTRSLSPSVWFGGADDLAEETSRAIRDSVIQRATARVAKPSGSAVRLAAHLPSPPRIERNQRSLPEAERDRGRELATAIGVRVEESASSAAPPSGEARRNGGKMSTANARRLPAPAPGAKPIKARGPSGRRCPEPGCTTVISIYNEADRCWLHSEPEPRPPLADR